ncbi:MAG: hypothetical protein K9G62_03700 [Alphaproteobacteria bacterium]|nr:hypothetical protein [Alphaproteobacteria bacterium]
MHSSRPSEHGNVLWFILAAVALLAALTMVISRSGTTVDQAGDVEQARIRAGQIMRYAEGLKSAVQEMNLRGVSENDISFESTATGSDYQNPNCTVDSCKVFAVGGGGQTYKTPPAGANDGSAWIFTGANNVGTAAGPLGTTAARTGNDLLMLMPNVKSALCIQINRDLSVGTPGTLPSDATGISTDEFTGTYAASLTLIDGDPTPFELDRKPAGCFTDTAANPAVTYFYYVLLPR